VTTPAAGQLWALGKGDVNQLAYFIERFAEKHGGMPGVIRARQGTIDERLAGAKEFNGVPILADEKVPPGHVWILA
jgi:hypothetical protein